MVESIKLKIWNLLKEKEVSLAMLINHAGEILWHKGREIEGQHIETGHGFSKSFLKKSLAAKKTIEDKNIIVTNTQGELPESARYLDIKSVLVQPIGDQFFLYVDSGIKNYFSESDRDSFKIIGELLSKTISKILEEGTGKRGLIGTHPSIQHIRDLILKYSIEEQPVLILGETGVGKSHVAEMIHQYSGRKGEFVTINTPSVSEQLFESEFFGHKKGAFTDASFNKKGLVQEAVNGTLFFDEIAEVPLNFQAKLLRFIETQKFRVLGESQENKADVRIIAATNKNLDQAIQSRQFREDLYYRLQVLEIEIPPLRSRKEDIQLLTLEKKELLKGKEIGAGFWDTMLNYSWPGNVRELITVLIRAGIHCQSPITGQQIKEIIGKDKKNQGIASNPGKIDQLLEDIRSGKSFWDVVKKPFLKRDLNREEVKTVIQNGLLEVGGRYIDLLKPFHIKPDEYHKFMCFLNDNDLR
jgi:transcriptional regulator with PAS, ATPase and Fis domain